jgi:DNA-binding transcriptional MerR regulator
MRASEIAQALGITPQTVRNWAAQFGANMGIVKEPSGFWAFGPEHLDTLRLVRDELAAGNTYEDVAQRLQNGTLGSPAIPSQINLLEALTGAIDNLAERIMTLEVKVDNLGDQLALPPAGVFGPQSIPQAGKQNGRKQTGAKEVVMTALKKAWERGWRLRR